MSIKFGEDTLIMPVLAPVGSTNTVVISEFVDLDLTNWVTFLVSFGAITTGNAGTCDDFLITVQASSIASSASSTAIPFKYRLSSAVDTHGWGAITDATSATTDATITTSDLTIADMLIDVDPCEISRLGEAHRWVGVQIDPSNSMAYECCITAFVQPRYPGNDMPSST